MKDVKMAELKIEAPLAKTEDWSDFSDFQSSEDFENSNKESHISPETNDNSLVDNFSETFSTSLEDLVNTFDEKITKCFRNYDEKVDTIAPVQVRTQEEIMNECQMWWTLTGNFGNILPIDWSKSYARKLQIPSLNLNNNNNNNKQESAKSDRENEDDDEDLAKDLDMHALILNSLNQEPIFTAEQVLEEIDEMMQDSAVLSPASGEEGPDSTLASLESGRSHFSSLMYQDKLESLSCNQLNEMYLELERLIQAHSEVLIQELALRDELEWEKELKNTFISLLLAVQSRRRQYHSQRQQRNGSKIIGIVGGGGEPKYLTTVIPYTLGSGPPSNRTLQILIKILKAINEDSPTVPTLLTDYILKVLCPT